MKLISKREAEALCLVIFGMSNKEIAKEMFITEAAVKNLLRLASHKLGYSTGKKFRTKMVSDFFLGNIDDDQCALVFKYFAERRLKMEHEKNAGLPRGVN